MANQTRRDLLKHFGIGTIIAPVALGAVQAKLIEVPKVEIVSPNYPLKEIPQDLDLSQVREIQLVFAMKNGTTRTFKPRWHQASGVLDATLPVRFNVKVESAITASPAVYDTSGQIVMDGWL